LVFDLEQASHIASQLGLDEHGLRLVRIPGGDIAEAWLLAAVKVRIFLKTLPLARAGLLSSEAAGLKALAKTGEIRVPKVIGRDVIGQVAWLALEYIEMDPRNEQCDAALGQSLARLHRHNNDSFGWHRDNFIGKTPQPNPRLADWSEFFLWHRLGFQLDRLNEQYPEAGWSGFQTPLFESWQRRFHDHKPEPALIHGDLWSGNAAMTQGAKPVIFDPAVHYADRECDLAMTRLFGGFSERFYQAYESTWPLPEGHAQRLPYYQLYHLLNHANLFGGGYLARSHTEIQQLLKQI